jgi:alpha-amylase/alpha-mannosidase (GH57 family)
MERWRVVNHLIPPVNKHDILPKRDKKTDKFQLYLIIESLQIASIAVTRNLFSGLFPMTYTAHQPSTTFPGEPLAGIDPLKTANGIYITVHGHFYQPPRENPYLDTIERQPSARPFHDWNARIHHECYRPNAFARVLNDRGELVRIVNNYEYFSFNIGPTLMSWLRNHDLEVYQRIIEADRLSCQRLNGHGNAIAQVYNHIILPLANQRDKETQIRWGIADFHSRFGRDPEGMWLAETAIDLATVEALIDAGIKFTILAPSQAQRCRPFPSDHDPEPQWHEVGGGQIDPTRPYRCFLPDGRYLDMFFYDGPISRDMGFNDVLGCTDHFAARLGNAIKGDHRPSQIISVATDGETFGHHKAGTEKCLAYAFIETFPKYGWTVSNYAHYLSICPPTWEVEIKPVTAWSCCHGVDRWQDDCGCGGGGEWVQTWRKPLREALNWLRDELIEVYEEKGREFLRNPWQARDEYIEVILHRDLAVVERFLDRHQCRTLSESERIDALRLLEMQRHALLMFTSCGWFFEEISRPEGTQILRYASRALELAGEVAGVQLEMNFLSRLAFAPSNVKTYQDGADIYRQLVIPARVDFEQVAAHYAISSLFTNYPEEHRVYCYQTRQLDYQKQQIGALTLAVGQVELISEITLESEHLTFSVLHLGGWDFHCCIQPFNGRLAYNRIKDELFDLLKQASVSMIIVEMGRSFGDRFFALPHLFAEERYRIMQQVTEETKKRLDQLYTQVYRDNYGILAAFQRDELPVPPELQVAAEIAIAHRCTQVVNDLERGFDDPRLTENHLVELAAIAMEASYLRCQLNIPETRKVLESLVFQSLWSVLHEGDPLLAEEDTRRITRMIQCAEKLGLGLSLDRVQELYYTFLHDRVIPNCLQGDHFCRWPLSQLKWLLLLGQELGVDVSVWL